MRGGHKQLTDLSVEQLQEKLEYIADTGVFIYTGKRRPRIKLGDRAGYIRPDGYREITICNTGYLEHRLAYLYMTGRWPENEIDHVNGVKHDNRWSNLRDISIAGNNQNIIRPKKRNQTGYLGVHKVGLRFRASIRVQKKAKHLGLYDTAEAAHQVYLAAKRALHEGNTL